MSDILNALLNCLQFIQLFLKIRTKDGRRYDYGGTGDLDTLLYIKSRVSPSQVR